MKRAALILACALPAGAASAQNYQTALPLTETERRVIESRLPTILEFSPPGEVERLSLPTGRVVAIRPYLPVRGAGSTPCRGYRIDLFGDGASMAVDGFRCRRADRNTWAIVEPEIVLAQEGSPRDLGAGNGASDRNTSAAETRSPQEPLSPDDGGLFAADETAPVPRPAPRTPVDIAAAPSSSETAARDGNLFGIEEGPLESPSADGSIPRDATVIAVTESPLPDPVRQEGSAAAALLPDVARVLSGEAEDAGTAPAEPAAEGQPERATESAPAAATAGPEVARVRRAGEAGARVVGAREETGPPPFAEDPRVYSALRELAYLEPGAGRPSDQSISRAIDDFARDERFALPVSSDVLIRRLTAALERRSGLPDCVSASESALCIVAR
jgi:hypothetical protein